MIATTQPPLREPKFDSTVWLVSLILNFKAQCLPHLKYSELVDKEIDNPNQYTKWWLYFVSFWKDIERIFFKHFEEIVQFNKSQPSGDRGHELLKIVLDVMSKHREATWTHLDAVSEEIEKFFDIDLVPNEMEVVFLDWKVLRLAETNIFLGYNS